MSNDLKFLPAQLVTIPLGILAGVATIFALRQVSLEGIWEGVLIGGVIGALLGMAVNALARKGGMMGDIMVFISKRR